MAKNSPEIRIPLRVQSETRGDSCLERPAIECSLELRKEFSSDYGESSPRSFLSCRNCFNPQIEIVWDEGEREKPEYYLICGSSKWVKLDALPELFRYNY